MMSVGETFTGKERDAETGLDYFGARYLSGAQGRFTSPDPVFFKLNRVVSPQRWNLFSYALNKPLETIDPDGRDAMGVVFTRYRAGHEVFGFKMQVPTGHGATIIVDSKGRTRYFEYGRYESNLGQTRRRPIPDLKLDQSGQPTAESLEAMFDKISHAYGQDSPIQAILIPADDAEDLAMQQYLELRVRQNNDAKRQAYTTWGHHCGTLICDALARANKRTMTNPYGTPKQVLDRLVFLYLFNSTTYSYDPDKKKGQRVKVWSTIRFGEPEDQQ